MFAFLRVKIQQDLWQMQTIEGFDQDLELKSIGCSISMRDVYFKTEGL